MASSLIPEKNTLIKHVNTLFRHYNGYKDKIKAVVEFTEFDGG